MKNVSKIRAFTLLEMAIVLAVIGLLAGGIVAGKSLIRSSQLTTHINESKLYLAAFNQFETKYGVLPGDMPNATDYWTAVSNGNGDKILGNPTNELFLVFQHLAVAELITGTYTGAAGPNGIYHGIPGTNLPLGPVNGLGYWFYQTGSADYVSGISGYFDGFYPKMLIAGLEVSGNSMPVGFYMKPQEALKLDTKYDDGQPGLGWIRTPDATACTTGTGATGAYYSTVLTTQVCRFILTTQ